MNKKFTNERHIDSLCDVATW